MRQAAPSGGKDTRADHKPGGKRRKTAETAALWLLWCVFLEASHTLSNTTYVENVFLPYTPGLPEGLRKFQSTHTPETLLLARFFLLFAFALPTRLFEQTRCSRTQRQDNSNLAAQTVHEAFGHRHKLMDLFMNGYFAVARNLRIAPFLPESGLRRIPLRKWL